MKLLYCPLCADCVLLRKEQRACACGRCSGRYVGIDKAVVAGLDVQVIGFDNTEFVPVRDRIVRTKPGEPKDDYHLIDNEFTGWFYGPNAVQVTKETTQTERDRREVTADATLKYREHVNTIVEFVRAYYPETRRELLADVEEELNRLALLAIAK